MSVTDGCNKDTSKPMGSNMRTLILSTEHLDLIRSGLNTEIETAERLVTKLEANNSGQTEIAHYWRKQMAVARDALQIVRDAS